MENLRSFGVENGCCETYTSQSFNDGLSHTNNLFIINFNIRSFNKNFDDFSTFLDQLKFMPDILIITETWFSSGSRGEISGYKGFHCSRPMDRRGGGVSIFVSRSLTAKILTIECYSQPELEYMWLKVLYSNRDSIDIIAVYRPPNNTLLQGFFSKIDEILNNIPVSRKIILAGDINICGHGQSRNTSDLIDIFRSYCLMPHITIPTRPNMSGNDSQIDHIW